MPNLNSEPIDPHASALARVADYLRRPQQFVAVAEARAAFRRTLEMAHESSVVLTTNGEPAAAIVPFATLEAMRGALLHLLIEEMATSFARVQAQVAGEPCGEATSEEELETLVADAVRGARRARSKAAPRRPRHR